MCLNQTVPGGTEERQFLDNLSGGLPKADLIAKAIGVLGNALGINLIDGRPLPFCLPPACLICKEDSNQTASFSSQSNCSKWAL